MNIKYNQVIFLKILFYLMDFKGFKKNIDTLKKKNIKKKEILKIY